MTHSADPITGFVVVIYMMCNRPSVAYEFSANEPTIYKIDAGEVQAFQVWKMLEGREVYINKDSVTCGK